MGFEEDKKKKLIKLYCPSMAKLVQMVAWEEQKLDLGYISRAFGLDPATVKINGHFIARGVDFVASSVTWKSLLSFFSARGLSTGSSDSDALTVDGKLSKLGSKRPHDPPSGTGNGVLIRDQAGETSSSSKELYLENPEFVSKKRLKDSNSGCCWAFSAVTAVEGINQIKNKKRVPLSVQELVDCDTAVNRGCSGGFMNEAFQYMIESKGITAESKYPYQGVDNGSCKANKSKKSSPPVAAEITGYEDIPANSESALLNAVANQTVSVAIDAGGSEFHFYKSGVFTRDCGIELNHGVTAVSYGETEDGTKYWVVRIRGEVIGGKMDI